MNFVTTPKIVVQKAPKTPVDKRPTIKEVYKEYLKNLNFEEHSIDRDGDLFRVICPECGSKNTAYLTGGFFVCGRKHLFSVYTEDGVWGYSELSPKRRKRILGDDLQKDGKDSHGHGDYVYFPKDAKIKSYFEFYYGYDTDNHDQTFEDAHERVLYLREQLKKFSEKFQKFYLPTSYFYTELNDASNGKPSLDIKSWPEKMWIQKFVLIMNLLNDINKIFADVDKSRGYMLIYLSKEG